MSDIPEDIMRTAEGCLSRNQWNPATVEIIARAILAERERCATVADKYAKDDLLHGEARLTAAYVRREIERGAA